MINRISTFLKWIRDLFRPRFRTLKVEGDAPETLRPRRVYVVTEDGEPWHAEMICPCGYKAVLYLNLLPDERPVWKLSISKARYPSLFPSVWRKKGCRSHFWLREGRIHWAKNPSS